jgi:hypothetical protein
MSKLDASQLTNFSDGLICESQVGNSQRPLTTVTEAINVSFDKIGSVCSRKGSTRLGNQILTGSNVLGLYQFCNKNGTNKYLVSVVADKVYYLSGGT